MFIAAAAGAVGITGAFNLGLDNTTDATARHSVARTLLAYSKLGVLMVGADVQDSEDYVRKIHRRPYC